MDLVSSTCFTCPQGFTLRFPKSKIKMIKKANKCFVMFLMFCRAPRSGARHVGLAPSGARVRHKSEHKKLPFALMRGRRYHEQCLNTGIKDLVSFEVLGQQPHAPAGSRSHHAMLGPRKRSFVESFHLWPEHAEEVQVVNCHIQHRQWLHQESRGEDGAGALSIS